MPPSCLACPGCNTGNLEFDGFSNTSLKHFPLQAQGSYLCSNFLCLQLQVNRVEHWEGWKSEKSNDLFYVPFPIGIVLLAHGLSITSVTCITALGYTTPNQTLLRTRWNFGNILVTCYLKCGIQKIGSFVSKQISHVSKKHIVSYMRILYNILIRHYQLHKYISIMH